jgi:hypothetical protein
LTEQTLRFLRDAKAAERVLRDLAVTASVGEHGAQAPKVTGRFSTQRRASSTVIESSRRRLCCSANRWTRSRLCAFVDAFGRG